MLYSAYSRTDNIGTGSTVLMRRSFARRELHRQSSRAAFAAQPDRRPTRSCPHTVRLAPLPGAPARGLAHAVRQLQWMAGLARHGTSRRREPYKGQARAFHRDQICCRSPHRRMLPAPYAPAWRGSDTGKAARDDTSEQPWWRRCSSQRSRLRRRCSTCSWTPSRAQYIFRQRRWMVYQSLGG
jgi:hypothetical protein